MTEGKEKLVEENWYRIARPEGFITGEVFSLLIILKLMILIVRAGDYDQAENCDNGR